MNAGDVMRRRHGVGIAFLVLLTACEFTEFEIDMEVDGTELVRRLVTRRVEVDHGEKVIHTYPADVLRRIATAYGVDVPDPVPGSPSFTGRFRGKTPDDVGGTGHLMIHQAPMGRLLAYSEQFRGEADPGVVLDRSFWAADQWIDLNIGWLRSEIGDQAGWDRIRTLLDQNLRRDLKNLVAMFFLTVGPDARLNKRAGEGPDGEEELLIRALHLLVQQGYLTDEDTPKLFRSMNLSGDRALDAGLLVLRRAIVRATGLSEDEAAVDSLITLFGSDEVESSLARYIETTDPWEERLANWEADRQKNPGAVRPEPSALRDDLLSEMIGSSLVFGTDDHLTVRLRCPTAPHRTNGRWDAASQKVEWKGTPAHKGQLPSMAYAFWTEPDRAFQEERFGRVLLVGEDLEKYVLWYRGLNPAERGQWDALVKGLQPGADALARIRSFTFQRPKEKPVKNPLPKDDVPQKEPGRDLLLEALKVPLD